MARNTGIHCLETSLIFLTEDVVVIVDNVEMNKLPRSWLTFQNTCTTAQALDTDTFESINGCQFQSVNQDGAQRQTSYANKE